MTNSELHNELMHVVVRLPKDYEPYGNVKRWEDPDKSYPDCSMGCKYYRPLAGELGQDWGVCVNRSNYRFSFLTFEHQAGAECYER
ncbi:MAG: hypothetical protein EBU90_22635 [Proteobacteria bacterium]|nr:hypothetical protein [Pseudomonadota bacterium]NBP16564.1 hypothetical protein [bacterium]